MSDFVYTTVPEVSAPQIQTVTKLSTTNPPNSVWTTSAACPSGTVVTGGGYHSSFSGLVAHHNFPVSASKWEVRMQNGAGLNANYTVYALCMQQ
jgi:hypothetical protein